MRVPADAGGIGGKMRVLCLCLLSFVGCALADECPCTKDLVDPLHGPDDRPPLFWQSAARLLDPGALDVAPKYCYVYRIENRSDRDVTDIFWKVVVSHKDVRILQADGLSAKSSTCNAFAARGSLQQPPPEGPLSFNVGNRFYQTTVYVSQSKVPSKNVAGIMPAKDTLELISELQVSNRRFRTTSMIRFSSSVRASNKGKDFQYELSSSGPEKLLVYWYIPVTAEFEALKMNRNPVTVAAGQKEGRTINSSDQVGWTPAAVQVFDFDGHWLATGTASAYCSLRGKAELLREQPAPRN